MVFLLQAFGIFTSVGVYAVYGKELKKKIKKKGIMAL